MLENVFIISQLAKFKFNLQWIYLTGIFLIIWFPSLLFKITQTSSVWQSNNVNKLNLFLN